jgi:leader peptidase (prepilin peptidase)/N-methyltransferase
VGLICGFPRSLLATFFAFLVGALFGIIILSKGERHKPIAFGPFLMFGCFLALVFGGKIIAWYLTLI